MLSLKGTFFNEELESRNGAKTSVWTPTSTEPSMTDDCPGANSMNGF